MSDIKELSRAIQMRSKPLRTMGKISRGFNRVLGAILLLVGIRALFWIPDLLARVPSPSKWMILYGLIMVLFWGIILTFPRRGNPLYAHLIWKNYKYKGTEITYQFTESEFVEHTLVSDYHGQYSIIERVLESPTHVFLFVNVGSAYMLRKDAFVLGDPVDFGCWVAGKCGKELVKIK